MYDFKALSAYDFEVLVRDLLQRKLGVILESFKSGRDGGIDLRHAPARDGGLLVQCKHYAGTGYSGLLAALKEERHKVQRLAPNRYCVATSVPLSPANKQEIRGLFAPWCRSDEDVIGLEDLNNLLGLHPEIERQHYKLWLTSTAILERVVHSDVYNQTVALVGSIQHKARLYVQNESFFDALALLKDHKYCIISGIPGIGKTFLAEILLLEHVRLGFEPVVVRSHIIEAFKLLKDATRQVFYYDDFLGQTGWEDKLEKNEEQSILDFIAYVRSHRNAVFILTTREYILQQARNVYEKLSAADFDHAKCIIKLESYTRRNKARILLNHIFFSDLPLEYRRVLARKENLLKIIDHRNYSPRIVEWMSGLRNVRDYSPETYPTIFLDTLDDPTKLWIHAYRNHLSPAARSMLLVLFSFQTAVDIDDLREAFEAFRLLEAKRFAIMRSPNEFNTALDELEGSFIRCERNSMVIVVAFHNPSVRDFLQRHISCNSEQALLLCESIVFYDQFRGVFTPQAARYQQNPVRIGEGLARQALTAAVLRTVSRTAKRHLVRVKNDGTSTTLNMARMTPEMNAAHALRMAADLPPTDGITVATQVLHRMEQRVADGTVILGDLPAILSASAEFGEVSAIRNRLIDAARRAYESIDDYEELDQFLALKDFLSVVPGSVSEELLHRVAKKLDEGSDLIFDWEIDQADDENELDELDRTARSFERVFGVSLNNIHERIEEQKEELQTRVDEPPDDWHDSEPRQAPDASDAEILAMFGSMFE